MAKRVVVAREHFGSIWPECKALFDAHWKEVEVDVPGQRLMDVDAVTLRQYSCRNLLLVITARDRGKLIGYCNWMISGDLESKGLVVANMQPWYLLPGYPRVAIRMFDRSIAELKLAGVKCIYPHHRIHGRGKSLGRFYMRRGAMPMQMNYALWIGDDNG